MSAERRIVCFYRANCLDSLAGAFAVQQGHNPDAVEFIPVKLGESYSAEGLDHCTIYLVGFCFPREQMVGLMANNKVKVFNHLESSAKDLEGLIQIDEETSSCVQAWEHFFQISTPPEYLFIQDRTFWKFELEGSRAWTEAALSRPLTLEVFGRIMDMKIDEMIVHGEILLLKEETDINALLPNARRINIAGQSVPVINANRQYVSRLGSILAKDELFAVVYSDGKTHRSFSLRTERDDVDLRAIAESFGGGGNRKSAGFKISYADPRFAKSHRELWI